MVKIHCCLAIILSEKGLQMSSWGEQFRGLNTDVQRHNRWFRLAQIPAPGWQVWCRSYGRYTPFSGGAARAQAGCYTVLKSSQLISDTGIIPAACPGNTMPSRRRLHLCSSAEWISLPCTLSRVKNRSLHDGIETSTSVFILTFPPLQGQTSVCLYYNPYAYR